MAPKAPDLSLYKERCKCRQHKKNTHNDRSLEKKLFRTAARVEGSVRGIAKCATEARTSLLQKYPDDQKHRQDYLDIGKNGANCCHGV